MLCTCCAHWPGKLHWCYTDCNKYSLTSTWTWRTSCCLAPLFLLFDKNICFRLHSVCLLVGGSHCYTGSDVHNEPTEISSYGATPSYPEPTPPEPRDPKLQTSNELFIYYSETKMRHDADTEELCRHARHANVVLQSFRLNKSAIRFGACLQAHIQLRCTVSKYTFQISRRTHAVVHVCFWFVCEAEHVVI